MLITSKKNISCILLNVTFVGWEYSTDGECKKMPSTKLLKVKIKSLPCLEQEGMIWIWPGDEPPAPTLPCLQPPSGFLIHAEVILTIQAYLQSNHPIWMQHFLICSRINSQLVMDLPVEHGLLLDNLLDLAHAPFTHTSTFAKGWSVPRFVLLSLLCSELR